MNRSKARDFFSDYYEGTLSSGLRQTMENAFADDQELRRDYEAFVTLIGGLDALRSEPVEPIGFLSERIEARLNQIDLEKRTHQRPFLLRFWMPVTASAVAGAAVLGFLLALQPESRGGANTAGIVGSDGSSSHAPTVIPRLTSEDGTTYLSYRASGTVRVTIRLGRGGEIIDSFDLSDRMMRSPLINSTPKSEILEVEFSNSTTKMLVAVPGQIQATGGTGSGTVMDFAKAIADIYRKPVEISTQYPESKLDWKLDGENPVESAGAQLKELGITIDVRESQVLLLAE